MISGRRLHRPRPKPDHSETSWIYVTAAVSWLGFLVHNVADLPDQSLSSPETLWPSLTTGALLAIYRFGATRPATLALFAWATLNLLGAALTVLPLALLPFDPEQTPRHYSFHVLYFASQVPLLTATSPFSSWASKPSS